MMRFDLEKCVVVFDLDDTIYKEADYHASGLRQVCACIEELYGKTISPDDLSALDSDSQDFLGLVCQFVGLPISVKNSLLWVYRLHTPEINMSSSMSQLIRYLDNRCNVLILTDGRSISQRKKLKALGLSHIPVYISEEYQSEKPDSLRFERIMMEYSADYYFYVADNPAKDFLAPNALKWNTVGLKGDEKNIHTQVCDGLSINHLPHRWINSPDELLEVIC